MQASIHVDAFMRLIFLSHMRHMLQPVYHDFVIFHTGNSFGSKTLTCTYDNSKSLISG